MEKCSLQLAANSIRHVIAYFQRGNADHSSIIDRASYGLHALQWMAKHEDLLKAAIELEKSNPHLSSLFKAFPGARIVDIRDRDEGEDEKAKTG